MFRIVLFLMLFLAMTGAAWGQTSTPTPAEPPPPVLQYVFALVATAIILTIICMPSRKR